MPFTSNLVDVFESMNLNESEEKEIVGYLARAKMADRVFSSIGNLNVIPDENNKKMLITEKIENKKNEHIYVCHKCTDSTTMNNMMKIDITEMKEKECIHAKLSEILFGNAKNKKDPVEESINAIDVLKDTKETIALVVPAKKHKKAPGIIFLSSRTKRPRCETCSGQKCIHVNIYMEESKKEQETESMRERSKEKNKKSNMENTKVVSEAALSTDKKESIKYSKNETDPFNFKGKDGNVFGTAINYPPKESEKTEIKRINTEDIFPKNIMVPKLEQNEKCEHGNKFMQKLNPGNIESRNPVIHNTSETKDSRNKTLLLMFHTTECCDCKKYFTGENKKLLRISSIEKSSKNLNQTVHFISYHILFYYHQTLISGGTSQNSFANAAEKMDVMLDQGESIPKRILNKGYEIFIHSLIYDKEDAWSCKKCPKELKSNEHELMFEEDEVHIADGINMGTTALQDLEKKETFHEEKLKGPKGDKIKGIEASERTFLPEKKEREIVEKLLKDKTNEEIDVKSTLKSINRLKSKSSGLKLIEITLKRISIENNGISEGHRLLLEEVSKCTPISQLFPSNNKTYLKQLKGHLENENNFFESYENTKNLTEAFPFIVKVVSLISKENKKIPVDISEIILSMMDLRVEYNQLAKERAMPRKKPDKKHKEAGADVFPNYPIHTMDYEYEADSKKDKHEDDGCNKDYNESASISGGITHITCKHSICKGFTAMKRGESPLMAVAPCVRRLPARVQARHRYLLYDNACQARKGAERRFPHRVRNWTFLVDRKHWPNHTACSNAFNIDEYPQLKNVNSQISEQLNRSLRKISTVCAYLGWENYLKVIELFLVNRNWDKKGKSYFNSFYFVTLSQIIYFFIIL